MGFSIFVHLFILIGVSFVGANKDDDFPYHPWDREVSEVNIFYTDDIPSINPINNILLTEGDELNVTHELRRPRFRYTPLDRFADIDSINITQYGVGKYTPHTRVQIMMNRTKVDGIFKVTEVLPVNKIQGRSVRPLWVTIEIPMKPPLRYVTELIIRDSQGKVIPLELLYSITLLTYRILKGDKDVYILFWMRFMKAYFKEVAVLRAEMKKREAERANTTTNWPYLYHAGKPLIIETLDDVSTLGPYLG